MPVKAQSPGITSRNSISNKSPGSAPFIKTGPVNGWARRESVLIKSVTELCLDSWLSAADLVSIKNSSPSSTYMIGRMSG